LCPWSRSNGELSSRHIVERSSRASHTFGREVSLSAFRRERHLIKPAATLHTTKLERDSMTTA